MATNNNKLTLHRKEFQMMTPMQGATNAGAFLVKDPKGERRSALFVNAATTQYFLDTQEDSSMLLPSFGLGGTFGAGACGCWALWSLTQTATGGSTTTIIYAGRNSINLVGRVVKFMSGSNVNLRRTITAASKAISGTNDICVLTLDSALPTAVANNDTFQLDTGRYFVLNAGTLSATSFRSYDILTGTLTSHTITGLPATWGTDGKMVATPSYVGIYATGTTTSATSTTLSNSAKTWTTNQWSNYVVRITSGTGIGQVRYISSNTGTQLTISSAWTTTPDSTSGYAIESNDDYIYLMGNGAVTLYRYNISSNTWATLTPTAARAAAPLAGMSANWVGKTTNSNWADESNIQDGRYIYSFQGGTGSSLHRYDIALNTWETITYLRQGVTFGTGSSYDHDDGRIYIQQNATGYFYYLDVVGNQLIPWNYDFYPQGTAREGDKMVTIIYYDGSGDEIKWVYYIGNSSQIMRRSIILN